MDNERNRQMDRQDYHSNIVHTVLCTFVHRMVKKEKKQLKGTQQV